MATHLMTGQVKSGGHDVAADTEKLCDLHVPGDPLLLTNFEIRCPPALLNPPSRKPAAGAADLVNTR
jgi:hypothetical protein